MVRLQVPAVSFGLAEMAGAVGGVVVGVWVGLGPLLQALLVLMVADVITGILAAAINGEVNSAASRKGLTRKALKLLLVFVIGWVSETAGAAIGVSLPAGQALAGGYCLTELVSLLENAQRAGVDLGPLARVLAGARSPDEQIRD